MLDSIEDVTGLVVIGLLAIAAGLTIGGIDSIGEISVLAAGDFADGYLAAGNFSVGVLSAGLFSVGVFSAGIFSVGIFAIGVFSVGIFSFGLYAAGFYVAKRSLEGGSGGFEL